MNFHMLVNASNWDGSHGVFCADAGEAFQVTSATKSRTQRIIVIESRRESSLRVADGIRLHVLLTLAQGMSRPLLKLGGGSVEILRDVFH